MYKIHANYSMYCMWQSGGNNRQDVLEAYQYFPAPVHIYSREHRSYEAVGGTVSYTEPKVFGNFNSARFVVFCNRLELLRAGKSTTLSGSRRKCGSFSRKMSKT
jgi:hypothetical protein